VAVPGKARAGAQPVARQSAELRQYSRSIAGLGKSVRSRSDGLSSLLATIAPMTEPAQQPLEHQLEEIGTQLTWVRDYL
jgi:hypothetical protein